MRHEETTGAHRQSALGQAANWARLYTVSGEEVINDMGQIC